MFKRLILLVMKVKPILSGKTYYKKYCHDIIAHKNSH